LSVIACTRFTASPTPLPPVSPTPVPVYANVWVIGDSLSRGLHASSEQTTYRAVLASLLRAQNPENAQRVDRFGACTLGRLERILPNLTGNPDLIVIEVGINDVTKNDKGVCVPIPDEEWPARYGAVLDTLQQRYPDATIVVATIPWLNWPERSRRYQRALQFNDWIQSAARERDIAVADLWPVTVGQDETISRPDQTSAFPPHYRGDNFHPSDEGHRVIAETIFRVLYPPASLN